MRSKTPLARWAAYGVCIAIFAFLVVRARDPLRFSAWNFGDAQTLMAAGVSRDEGFLATHFLWVPHPSSPIGKFLDEDPIRQHAHGTGGDDKFSGLGPKRMYTHWPSWYSVPYGVFAKLGYLDKSVFQIWASLLSVASLLFFFLFLQNVIGAKWAALATVGYGLSPSFFAFADSLATMPYDDFFRFGFLWSWSRRHRERHPVAGVWLSSLFYLGNFLTTLDSFAFIPVAAFLSDWVIRRKIYYRDLSILCACGVAAVAVQWTQNASYLGVADAFRDWKGYYWANGKLTLWERLITALSLFVRAFNLTLVPCVLLLLGTVLGLRNCTRRAVGWWLALVAGGLAFAVIIPGKVPMAYQTRQLLPFAVLSFVFCIKALEDVARHFAFRIGMELSRAHSVALLLCGLFIFVGNFYDFDSLTVKEALDYPAVAHVSEAKRTLLDRVRTDIPGHRVFFQVRAALSVKRYVRRGYDQVEPVEEYYAGGPVLTVPDYQALRADLAYLWERTQGSFVPIVLWRARAPHEEPPYADFSGRESPWRIEAEWREGDLWALRLAPTPTSGSTFLN